MPSAGPGNELQSERTLAHTGRNLRFGALTVIRERTRISRFHSAAPCLTGYLTSVKLGSPSLRIARCVTVCVTFDVTGDSSTRLFA